MSEPLSPDWAIVGVPVAKGVRVIASKNMKPGSSLSIVERTADTKIGGRPTRFYQHDHWKITIVAEDVVIVDAEDYPTALRILMANWSVPEPEQPVREIFSAPVDPWPSPTAELLWAEMPVGTAEAAMRALEEASKPMSDAERALIEGLLAEEP